MGGIMPGATFSTSPVNGYVVCVGGGGTMPQKEPSAASSGVTWYLSISAYMSSRSSCTLPGLSAARSCAWLKSSGR